MSLVNMSVLSMLQVPLTAAVTGVFTGGAERKLRNEELIASGFVGGVLSGFEEGASDHQPVLARFVAAKTAHLTLSYGFSS